MRCAYKFSSPTPHVSTYLHKKAPFRTAQILFTRLPLPSPHALILFTEKILIFASFLFSVCVSFWNSHTNMKTHY